MDEYLLLRLGEEAAKEFIKMLFGEWQARRSSAVSEGQEAAIQRGTGIIIKTNMPATIYWLGNDLMWTKDQAFRGSSPTWILNGLKSSLKYIKDLGFAEDEFPVERLDLQIQIMEKMEGEEDLERLRNLYLELLARIESVKWYIHTVFTLEESTFVKVKPEM